MFRTTHNLDFEASYHSLTGCISFRVGTCYGLYDDSGTSYDIIAIFNRTPGNGHFEDVLEWFEASCKRDKRNLRIMEFFNQPFKKHLIEKRGFVPEGENNVIKYFNI